MRTFFPSAVSWGLCLWGSPLSFQGQTQPLPTSETEVLDTGISTDILNQPVTRPFRPPGLLLGSSRPVYGGIGQQVCEQRARTAPEVLHYLVTIRGDGTAGTPLKA